MRAAVLQKLVLAVIGISLTGALIVTGMLLFNSPKEPTEPLYLKRPMEDLSTQQQVKRAHVRLLRAYLEYETPYFWKRLMVTNCTLLSPINDENYSWQQRGVPWFENMYEEDDRLPYPKLNAEELINVSAITVYNSTAFIPDTHREPLRGYNLSDDQYLAVAWITSERIRQRRQLSYFEQVYEKRNNTWVAVAGRWL